MVTPAEFQQMMDRKDQQVAELLGRDEPREPVVDAYAEKVRQAAEAIETSRAASRVKMGVPRRREPAPEPPPRAAWDVTLHQVIAGYELTTTLALELRRLLQDAGPKNVLAGLRAMGVVSRVEPNPEAPEPRQNIENAAWLS